MTRAMIFRPVVRGRVQIEPLTVDEYHRMIRSGELPEDTSIELIHGFLTKKNRAAAGDDPMTIGHLHVIAVQKFMRLAPQIERLGCYLQIQQPVVIAPDSEPEPDASIIAGKLEDHSDRLPRAKDACCIIEISDSSLAEDRTTKLQLYASAGIAQYLIINLVERNAELHTLPMKQAARYRKRQVFGTDETFTLILRKKQISVAVKSILPW